MKEFEDFRKEFKDLVSKHKLTIVEQDVYGDNESYMGTDRYLIFNKVPYFGVTLDELLYETFKTKDGVFKS